MHILSEPKQQFHTTRVERLEMRYTLIIIRLSKFSTKEHTEHSTNPNCQTRSICLPLQSFYCRSLKYRIITGFDTGKSHKDLKCKPSELDVSQIFGVIFQRIDTSSKLKRWYRSRERRKLHQKSFINYKIGENRIGKKLEMRQRNFK